LPVAPRGALTPPRGRSYAKVCDVYASSKEHSVLKVRPAAKRCVGAIGGSGVASVRLTRSGPQPGLETIEGYLRTYGEPLAARVSEKAPMMLASCDEKARRRVCALACCFLRKNSATRLRSGRARRTARSRRCPGAPAFGAGARGR